MVPFLKGAQKIFPNYHKDMTRFWITLDQAISMVEWSFKNNHGGEIMVPKIKF